MASGKFLYFFGVLALFWCSVPKTLAYGSEADSLIAELKKFPESDTSAAYISLLSDIGEVLFEKEKNKEARQYYQKALDIAEKSTLEYLIPKIKISLAEVCFHIAEYQCALTHSLEALNNGFPYISPRDSSFALTLLGTINHHIGNVSTSYNYYYQAHELALILDDTLLIADFHYAIGQLDAMQSKFDSALEHFEKAKKIYERLGTQGDISDCLAVIGDLYHSLNDFEKALEYKHTAFEIDSANGYVYGMAYCSYGLAETYIELNEYQKALGLLKRSFTFAEQVGDLDEAILAKATIGWVNCLLGNPDEGINILKTSLTQARELTALPTQLDILQFLKEAYEQQGNYKQALIYQDEYYQLHDSLYSKTSLNRIASLQADFEYQSRKRQLNIQKKEQEIAYLKKTNQLDVYRKWLFLFVSLCLALIAVFIFFMYEKAREHNLEMKETSKVIKKKNNELIESNEKLSEAINKLSDANEKLSEANDELEQFSYISAHDLKTPLRMIGSFSSLLARRYSNKLDRNADEYIKYIVDGVRQMNTMLEDIYNYSKASNIQEKHVPVDLDNLVQNLLHHYLLFDNKPNADIFIGQLPVVMGNKTQLKQVFQNLIDNAFKYTEEGKMPRIDISSKIIDEATCQISISDNGIGIDDAYREKIFTLFKRLHHTGLYEGTGVGLAICKKIIEKHDGKIWVDTTPGEGTVFHFTLKNATRPKLAESDPLEVIDWPFVPAENL